MGNSYIKRKKNAQNKLLTKKKNKNGWKINNKPTFTSVQTFIHTKGPADKHSYKLLRFGKHKPAVLVFITPSVRPYLNALQ